jgi:hypothetical protein
LPDGGAAAALSSDAGVWTWQPLEGTKCGNGSIGGLALNPGEADSTDLLVYLSGGGACWEGGNCYVHVSSINLGITYTQQNLDLEALLLTATGVMDRRHESPFQKANWAYLPYCTGDAHLGRALRNYDTAQPNGRLAHHGAINAAISIAHLKATFPKTKRVWVVGTSAGGYGAQFLFDRFADAFAPAEAHLLADSAQLVTPWVPRRDDVLAAWNARMPKDCAQCADTWSATLSHLRKKYPRSRIALMGYLGDATLATFNELPNGELRARTQAVLDDHFGRDNAHAFMLGDTYHSLIQSYAVKTNADGSVKLKDWVDAWATGGGAFVDVR